MAVIGLQDAFGTRAWPWSATTSDPMSRRLTSASAAVSGRLDFATPRGPGRRRGQGSPGGPGRRPPPMSVSFAQGQNIEASISCALVLKQIGVPWVIAKAETDLHGQILVKVGADRIVYPEKKPASRLPTLSISAMTSTT